MHVIQYAYMHTHMFTIIYVLRVCSTLIVRCVCLAYVRVCSYVREYAFAFVDVSDVASMLPHVVASVRQSARASVCRCAGKEVWTRGRRLVSLTFFL